MAKLERKTFDSPEETRKIEKGKLDIVKLGDVTAMRSRFEPGWRWSECIKPVVGGESCQAHHIGVIVSGTMHVRHDDGTEGDATAGTAYVIEPGHDAWVIGDEPVVAVEFDSSTAQTFAKPA